MLFVLTLLRLSDFRVEVCLLDYDGVTYVGCLGRCFEGSGLV